MNKFQATAVMHYLSDYPDEVSDFDEMMELVAQKDGSIVIWQPFEYYDGEDVAKLITDMSEDLARTFG
jgi:hypothetical protein